MTDHHIHVGGRRVDIEKAAFWIKDYFDETADREAAALGKGPVYTYPAYDRLATGSGPNELNDGDLPAPLVLNAGPSIKAVYSLQRVRPKLEHFLAATPTDLTLRTAVAKGAHTKLLGALVSVLDPFLSLPAYSSPRR